MVPSQPLNARGVTIQSTISRLTCRQLLRHIAFPTAVCTASSRQYSITARSKDKNAREKERVVILGSGWAGYAFARTLDPAKFERVVISPRSYFVFTPLLASTAVGTLEFRAVLEPVRRLAGVDFYQGWADDVDFGRKVVHVEANAADDLTGGSPKLKAPGTGGKGEEFDVPYDKLVIACGAYSQTFGIQGVREHAHFLRDISDARRIRLRVLSLFEQCAHQSDAGGRLSDDDRRDLLHFAIVGGGPTGIEFAAELHDLIHEDLARIYPDLLRFVRVTVYDIAPKVLPMFDQALARYAMDTFARQGIRVRTEHHLEGVRLADGALGSEHGALRIRVREKGDEEVGAGMVVWSTGLMMNPLVEKLAAKEFALPTSESDLSSTTTTHLAKDPKTGGIVTDAHLRARTTTISSPSTQGINDRAVLDDVFVIGDCAVMEDDRALPKTAQVASQQAVHLAKQLNAGPDNSLKPFRFRNWGTLTYLGSWKAIHQGSADELRGWVAFLIWRGAYLTKSMSVRNKIMVPVYWFMSWLFGRDIGRF